MALPRYLPAACRLAPARDQPRSYLRAPNLPQTKLLVSRYRHFRNVLSYEVCLVTNWDPQRGNSAFISSDIELQ